LVTDRIYFSPSWKSMLGYAPNELKNCFSTWENLVHHDDIESAKKAFTDTVQDKSRTKYTNTFRMMHRDGHSISILSRGIIVRDQEGEAIRTVGTHLDRTEIIALQNQLDEAWVVAQAEARANEAKSKFLATVSHEIRNPLNSVCGFARLIQDEAQEPELQRHAQLLNQTAGSLNSLLNDLLDFAKIDLGKLEIINEPFDLSALLETLTESAQMLCRDKKLGFEYSKRWVSGTGYLGDEGRIRQIIQNLLNNAIKFTHKGQVTLRVCTEELSLHTEQITIEVVDTGIGMPSDRLDRLFKPFSQIHSEMHNQYGGTGLGLSIVKSLTELMQGKVSCESVQGEGSKFSVVLQLPTSQEAARKELGLKAAITPRRVLIADDSPTNLKILSLFLSKRGHHVVCAADGNQAVEELQNREFDYVILDMDMPGQNGLQVVSQIKSSTSPSANAVFACLSGHADKSSNAAALDRGFDKFFAKPVDWDEILKFLK
jgi:PAS domain S-box-containing protein